MKGLRKEEDVKFSECFVFGTSRAHLVRNCMMMEPDRRTGGFMGLHQGGYKKCYPFSSGCAGWKQRSCSFSHLVVTGHARVA